METFDYDAGYQRLLEALQAQNLTLHPQYLQPRYPEGMGRDREMTLLFDQLLDSFNRSIKWFNLLVDPDYQPDWYAVHVDPDRSPIDFDDYTMAATSQAEALGWVLSSISGKKLQPTSVNQNGSTITIMGDTGVWATIEKMQFSTLSDSNQQRAHSALKGIGFWESGEKLFKGLSKLQGYSQPSPIEDDNPKWAERDPLHNTPNNLCTILLNLLKRCVQEPVKRHQAQELLAKYFGFESWQHFKHYADQNMERVESPYMVYKETRNNCNYQIRHYTKGIPTALYLYGQLLSQEERKTYTVDADIYWSITNYTENSSKVYWETGERYMEESGLSMSGISAVYPSDEFVYVAATLLDSGELEEGLREYFLCGLEPKDRYVELNARDGVKKEDHLFLGNWVFYVNHTKPYGFISADRIEDDGTINLTRVGSYLHKAALVEVDGQFWLATDWDEKPKHHLTDLSAEQADLLESRFICESNWRPQTVMRIAQQNGVRKK